MALNNKIENFVEIYAICNQGWRQNYSVTYEVPESNDVNFFSVIWHTNKDAQPLRIDSLSFYRNRGELVAAEDIFNIYSTGMLDELSRLSDDYIGIDTSWEEFVTMFNERKIQLYIKAGKWYMVFNPTTKEGKLINIEIPAYFLKGNDVTNTR